MINSLAGIDDKLYLNLRQGAQVFWSDTTHKILAFDADLEVEDSLCLNPIFDGLVPNGFEATWIQMQMEAGPDNKLYLLALADLFATSGPTPCGSLKAHLLVFDPDLSLDTVYSLHQASTTYNIFISAFKLAGQEVIFTGDYRPCGSTDQRGYISKLNLQTGTYLESSSVSDSLVFPGLHFFQAEVESGDIYLKTYPDHIYNGGQFVKLNSNLDFNARISLADTSLGKFFSQVEDQKIVRLGQDSLLVLGTASSVHPNINSLLHWNLATSLYTGNQIARRDTFSFCGYDCNDAINPSFFAESSLTVDGVNAENIDSILVVISSGTTFNYYARDSMELYLYNLNGRTGKLNWRKTFRWPKAIATVAVENFGANWALAFSDAKRINDEAILEAHVWILDQTGTLLSQQSVSLQAKADIALYPNPAQDILNIKTDLSFHTFSIYTIDGSVVKEGLLGEKSQIDISSLEKGVYLIKLEDTASLRFIKY